MCNQCTSHSHNKPHTVSFEDLEKNPSLNGELVREIHDTVVKLSEKILEISQEGRPFSPTREESLEKIGIFQDNLNARLDEYLSSRVRVLHGFVTTPSTLHENKIAANLEIRATVEIQKRRSKRSPFLYRKSVTDEFQQWRNNLTEALNLVATSALEDRKGPLERLKIALKA